MAIQLIPVSSKASLPTAINTLNNVVRQLAANSSTSVINQGGGRAVVSGKIATGQYGEVFYDRNGIARILVGQNSSGEPVIAMSGDNTSILDTPGCFSIGKLTTNRYGQLLYDANGTPRLVIGQDANGDPRIALSSGSNSVLTSSNERFAIGKIANNRYGQILSDQTNIPRLVIGQDSNGDPMFAISSGSNSVLTNEKIKIGKLNSTRYGELFKDSSGTARMVIGEDGNGDPMFAISSGSHSVLSGNERFKIANIGSNRYGQILSDSTDTPRIYIGQKPTSGEPVIAISKSGTNVLTALGGS